MHGYPRGHSQTPEKINLLSIVDYILISPCGLGNVRPSEAILRFWTKEWRDFPAIKNGKVTIAEGNNYFNRSSIAVQQK